MAPKKNQPVQKKEGLHPRNLHSQRYDFDALIVSCPSLAPFVAKNQFGDLSVDFSDPAAVKMLNKALLHHFYKVENWDIPPGYLCPPIPGRADYIHHMADLLAASNKGGIPQGKHIRGLDIGMGANCVYPIIGHRTYGWRFTGSDIDALSVKSATLIVESNRSLAGAIQCRLQKKPDNIFVGIINDHDAFDFTLCNPPFHASLEEATAGSERKVRNLRANASKKGSGRNRGLSSKNHAIKPVLNFGGQKAELWCPGGEAAFIQRMTTESSKKPENCFWFSTLVSKQENLPALYKSLRQVSAVDVRTIKMVQGQKMTRIVAWTFLSEEQQIQWREKRWGI